MARPGRTIKPEHLARKLADNGAKFSLVEDVQSGAYEPEEFVEGEGWPYKGKNKDEAFYEKNKAQQGQANSSVPENKDRGRLPSEKEAEILQLHQQMIWAKEGAWMEYSRQLKDSGLSEEEKQAGFKLMWQEDLQDNIKFLLENDKLKDWQEFVAQRAAKPKVRAQEEIVVPEGKSDERAESLETENWWESQIFINRDSGEPFFVKSADEANNKITLMGEGQNAPTITLDLNDLHRKIETPGEAWSLHAKEAKEASVDSKDKIENEGKEWREVEREVEVDAVGDLHSNFLALKENLKSLGVAKENSAGGLEWTGGERKVVMIGDIIGDRHEGGKEILLALGDLQAEAEAAGGRIDALAGNHDDFVISYLSGRSIAGGNDAIDNCAVNDQGIDLLSFSDYGSERLKNYDFSKFQYERWDPDAGKHVYDPVWKTMREEQPIIIENMRKDEVGRKLLEQMTKYKIAEVHDDTLFVHTDFTEKMVETLLKGRLAVPGDVRATVANINEYFQQNLKKILLEGQEPDDNFDELRDTFLDTGNRQDFTNNLVAYRRAEKSYKDLLERSKKEFVPAAQLESYRETAEKTKNVYEAEQAKIQDFISQFKSMGINAVIRGHSGGKFDQDFSDDQFPIITSDMSAFKGGPSQHRSIIRIKTDGVMERGTIASLPISGGKDMAEVRK